MFHPGWSSPFKTEFLWGNGYRLCSKETSLRWQGQIPHNFSMPAIIPHSQTPTGRSMQPCLSGTPRWREIPSARGTAHQLGWVLVRTLFLACRLGCLPCVLPRWGQRISSLVSLCIRTQISLWGLHPQGLIQPNHLFPP